MKAKDYLKKIHTLDEKIKQRVAEMDQLKSTITSIGSFDYSKERVQVSLKGDAQYERIANQIVDIEREIRQTVHSFIRLKHGIIKEIHMLEDVRHVQILFKKYVEYKSLELIAVEMEYSYDRIRHIHGQALLAFEKKFFKVDTQ